MSITSYALLQTAMSNWLANTVNAAIYPDMITLFEAAANRRLRVRQQETTTSLTTTSGSVAVPTDYLAFRRMTWQGSTKVELEYVEPSYLQAAYATTPSDVPRVFTVEDSTFKVRPVDDTTALELVYYAKIPALATTDPNWLLTAHPDVYLFGALAEAAMFDVNDERFPLWKARRDELFDEIQMLSNRTRGVGGIRVMGSTP